MIKNKHIIVIRLSAMGDVAMTVPVIRAFVEQHPDVKITFVSKGFLKPLFEDIKNVSFFSAETDKKHKGFLGLYRLFSELKQLNPTHIADLHNVLRSKIVRTFFRLSGYPVAFIDKGRAEKKALTRTKNKVFKQLKTSHQRYADVFEKLGFPIALSNPMPIKKPQLNNIITSLTGEKTSKWIGIAPFAAFASKVYPLDLMEKVIKELSEKNYKVLLFGGKSDATLLEPLAEKYQNVISVAGKLGGLKNEIDLISNLDLMLSMDSGNAHFAAMQQVKTITLWGGTHPYAGFAPFNQPNDYCILPDLEKYPNLPCSVYGNKICDGYEDVMRSITPKKVVDKITSIL
ncbi:glycosyltransferase family 9 protein [Tenacibaculum sp. IB213877]|uniref:glycosyltransferase family 9 protein n=1 Tax=Tenacibaculum sp. IB213877 TaxID=3097351 RepID=UPI002A59CE31|nr:glycosyltransferase family 9 protein [Tenacibaculum sp. IB213877]MDY0780649.1 glycosyltransferase family 9 protein [Tenacibaculum sp. IB213877]